MGCVLGKRAAGEKQKSDERRDSGSAAVTVQNGLAVRGKEKVEEAPAATAAPAALPEFRLRRGLSTGDEGWPSWLSEVAGHAIKDWKPRRANTFEKLDKVIAAISFSGTSVD